MEQNMVLKLMRVREGAIIPKQATAGSAGYDLCACMDAPQTIEPGERCVFPSGLAAEIPAGTAGFVFTRSGLGIKKGIHVTNGVGVIDSDYRGEIQIGLHNLSAEPYTVQPGERARVFWRLSVQTASTQRRGRISALKLKMARSRCIPRRCRRSCSSPIPFGRATARR